MSKWHDSMRGEHRQDYLTIHMNKIWKLIYIFTGILTLSFLTWIVVCGVADSDVTFSVGTFNGGIHK